MKIKPYSIWIDKTVKVHALYRGVGLSFVLEKRQLRTLKALEAEIAKKLDKKIW